MAHFPGLPSRRAPRRLTGILPPIA